MPPPPAPPQPPPPLLGPQHSFEGKAPSETAGSSTEPTEETMAQASRALQKGLQDTAQAIDDVFAELNRDELLVRQDHSYVLETWDKINELLAQRKEVIVAFGDNLEGLEIDRSAIVGGMLRDLVDELMAIAYKSPGEIER